MRGLEVERIGQASQALRMQEKAGVAVACRFWCRRGPSSNIFLRDKVGSAELTHCLVTRTTVPQMGYCCVRDPPTEKRLTVAWLSFLILVRQTVFAKLIASAFPSPI